WYANLNCCFSINWPINLTANASWLITKKRACCHTLLSKFKHKTWFSISINQALIKGLLANLTFAPLSIIKLPFGSLISSKNCLDPIKTCCFHGVLLQYAFFIFCANNFCEFHAAKL